MKIDHEKDSFVHIIAYYGWSKSPAVYLWDS